MGFAFLFFAGMAAFWFFYLMNPWLGFTDSDSAVPFQQSISPWIAQDLYYWGTARMGMLFEVIWKAGLTLLRMRESIVGSQAHLELFYFAHVLVVFLGFPFWLALLDRWSTRFVFFAFFVPNTHWLTRLFLMPAQPYGVLFSLNGCFFWTLLKLKEGRTRDLMLGTWVGALMIQHELSGLIAFTVYSITLIERSKGFKWDKIRYFLMTFVPILAACFYFKTQSQKWDSLGHYGLNPASAFAKIFWDTVRNGEWWLCVRRGVGHVLTLGMIVFAIDLWRRRNTHPLQKSVSGLAFLGVMVAIVMVHMSHWYLLNGKNLRYFSNLMPLLIWSMLKQLETIPRFNFTQLALWVACVVPIFKTHEYALWLQPWSRPTPAQVADRIDKKPGQELMECFDDDETCLIIHAERFKRFAHAVQESGCGSYLDNYWNSHELVIVSAGEILTSAGDHVRNPDLLKRVMASRPICVDPKFYPTLQNSHSDLNCTQAPAGFLICRDSKS